MPDRDRPLAGYPAEDGPRYVETIRAIHDESGVHVQVDVFADQLDEAFLFVIDEHVRQGASFDEVTTATIRAAVFAERATEAADELLFLESITVSGVRIDVFSDPFHDQCLFLVKGELGACLAFDDIKGDHDRRVMFLEAAAEAVRVVGRRSDPAI